MRYGERARVVARRDAGTVTAEMAVVLPALAAVVGLLLWAVTVLTAQLRCVDAARATARSLARGDSAVAATEAARSLAPSGARIVVTRSGGLVSVQVSAAVRPVAGIGDLAPALTVSSTAVAEVEGDWWPS